MRNVLVARNLRRLRQHAWELVNISGTVSISLLSFREISDSAYRDLSSPTHRCRHDPHLVRF